MLTDNRVRCEVKFLSKKHIGEHCLVAKHFAKCLKTITTLVSDGISIKSEQFRPGDTVTQSSFAIHQFLSTSWSISAENSKWSNIYCWTIASDKTKTDKTLNATKCQSWLSDCPSCVMRYSQKEFKNLVSLWLSYLRFIQFNSFRTLHLLFRQQHRMAKKQSDWHLESGSESWHHKSGKVKVDITKEARELLRQQCWAPRMSTDGCEWNQIISF